MVIEGAERYGLAQLHQLRGRVGRGDKQSYCVLFTNNDHAETKRLQFFASTLSGMDLSEYDLKRRGSGDIYGTRQHGFKELKVADLSDYDMIKRTKSAVEFFLNTYKLSNFPQIQQRVSSIGAQQIARD
jgi:ATP-dependent DNA helicase RecG